MSSFFAFSGILSGGGSRSAARRASVRPFWLVSLVLCVLCLGASEASAQQDDKARARTLFSEGVSAFDNADYAQALDNFKQAYRLAPHPVVRVNMANCYERLGRYVEAVFNYERFLEEGGAVDEDQRTEIEGTIARLKKKVGTLALEVEPAGAVLAIDGEPAARGLDGRISLAAGPHRVRVTKPGYSPAERTVILQGGDLQTLRIELLPEETEFLAGPVPAPEDAQEFAPSERGTRAAPREGRPMRTAAFTLLGTGALAGVGAVVTGLLALKAQSDFDDAVERSNSPTLSASERAEARDSGLSASDRAEKTALVTDILTVGAVACASTAFVLWWFDRKQGEKERRVTLRPEVSPTGLARITLQGAF